MISKWAAIVLDELHNLRLILSPGQILSSKRLTFLTTGCLIVDVTITEMFKNKINLLSIISAVRKLNSSSPQFDFFNNFYMWECSKLINTKFDFTYKN